MEVTVTDAHTRKAFDIINIYKNKGYKVSPVSSKSFLHRAFLSLVYLSAVKKEPDAKSCVLPTEDQTILHMFDKNCFCKIPPKESFKTAIDKKSFSKFCEKEGFLTPKTFTLKELLEKDELPTALIVKPKSGSGALGIKFIDDIKELKSLDINEEEYIIQERLKETKKVEGAFFLFDNAKPVSFYSHKRLKTYPSRGGVSIYSVSTNNQELKKIGEKLLSKLNWNGFAMIEFIKDENGYKIIELNPRVWGSIMLSEFCGSNMLENYVLLCYERDLKEASVKTGKKIRWLIPWDIKYLLKNFYRLDTKDTCYINFSYAGIYRGGLFLLYQVLNPLIIKKLFKKIFV